MSKLSKLSKLPTTKAHPSKRSNKWIQDELAKQGFRMVPSSHITEVEQLGHRFDAFSISITASVSAASRINEVEALGKKFEAFATSINATIDATADATSNTDTAIRILGDQLLPILSEIRAELRDHRHTLTDHGHRLTALEKQASRRPARATRRRAKAA